MSGLNGVRVLVVENDAMNAMLLELQLEQAGATVIAQAAVVAEGLRLIRELGPDIAVLDYRLGNGETSEPVADLLLELGIPFVVATGASREALPSVFKKGEILTKPYLAEELIHSLLSSRNKTAVSD
jgi:CheY-like chemotaxis protein